VSASPSLSEFARHLVSELAVPELARGYSDLVSSFSANSALATAIKAKGMDDVLSDEGEAGFLKKENKELVTAFEKKAEARMTEEVRNYFPDHAIIGEEHGFKPGGNTCWVFDPVDGTSAMIRHALAQAFNLPAGNPVPAFGITVAVVEEDEATVGVIAELQPKGGTLSISNLWLGKKGKRTLCNGGEISLLQAPATLSDTVMACTVPPLMFNTKEKWSGFQALMEATKTCITDQNCIGFMGLLSGGVGIAYESDLAYHDAAALLPILEGAGIIVTDAGGRKITFPQNTIGKEFTVLAAQEVLHSQALKYIKKGVPPEQNRFTSTGAPLHGYAQKFSAE
jgi:fructose-1,6-bisphosphatase/inositol monophosphatase family enzyme